MANNVYRRQGIGWLILAVAIAPLPSLIKIAVYRFVFGYDIGKRVRIGFSVISTGKCRIGDDVSIGHCNVILHNQSFDLGSQTTIRFGNIIRGGNLVSIGERSLIDRFNEINCIIDPEIDSAPPNEAAQSGRFLIGPECVITAQHKIDFTGGVTFGKRVILGGRLSSLWTHNRQATGSISIGQNSYLGSGLQMVPDSSIGQYCVVGIGSVVTKLLSEDYVLVAGVPAKAVKPLDEESRILVTYPTRPDLDGITDAIPPAG